MQVERVPVHKPFVHTRESHLAFHILTVAISSGTHVFEAQVSNPQLNCIELIEIELNRIVSKLQMHLPC